MNAPKGKADMKEFEEWFKKEFIKDHKVALRGLTKEELATVKQVTMFTWQAASASSRTATLKEILEALPLDSRIDSSVMDESSMTFARHQNYWLNEIRAIIEKKLESV